MSYDTRRKAYSLGQEYFPEGHNMWERPNYEAQWVANACIEMAEWEHKRLVEKACEWLRATSNFYQGGSNNLPEVICMFDNINEMVDNFKKVMEE